jgi:hypothetical protein
MSNDHQLFEEWLFSVEDTPHDDAKTLEEHRTVCDRRHRILGRGLQRHV